MTADRGGSQNSAFQWLLGGGAAALALIIFVIDTFTPIEVVISMLYVAPVLLTARVARPAGIVMMTGACGLLALTTYIILAERTPGFAVEGGANVVLVFGALAATTAIVLQARASMARLREQASLLDLTHDAIFVRGMDGVIRY